MTPDLRLSFSVTPILIDGDNDVGLKNRRELKNGPERRKKEEKS